MPYRSGLNPVSFAAAVTVLTMGGRVLAEEVSASPHSVALQAQYLPGCGVAELGAEYGVQCSDNPHEGVFGAYGYRFARNLSIGLGASLHGHIGATDHNAGWVDVFSAPVLFTVDPDLSDSVRLVLRGGLSYEHAWGHYYGRSWNANGLGAAIDVGLAVAVTPKLEILGTVGMHGGVLKEHITSHYFNPIYELNLPVGLGVRYTL